MSFGDTHNINFVQIRKKSTDNHKFRETDKMNGLDLLNNTHLFASTSRRIDSSAVRMEFDYAVNTVDSVKAGLFIER